MGQARQRKEAATRSDALPKVRIAEAVRTAVVEAADALKIKGGLCLIHAAVGQRLLEARYGLSATLVAGDFSRAVNDRLTHSYAPPGQAIDAEGGDCHVWLVDPASKAVIDFDAWEEPVRYEAAGSPHGPWTAPRPDFYWTASGTPQQGLARVAPDRTATAVVMRKLEHGATALLVATALAKALDYIDLLPL